MPISISDYITIVGIVVGIIGIVVGIIGFKSLSAATKIKNTASKNRDSTIQQAQTINNGLDSHTVIKLAQDTTQQELEAAVQRLIPRFEIQDGILYAIYDDGKEESPK